MGDLTIKAIDAEASGAHLRERMGIVPMLSTYATEPATLTIQYRGYDIEVSRVPSGWRAGVFPRRADLPILRRSEVHACDPDEAVIEAMDRVDGALRW